MSDDGSEKPGCGYFIAVLALSLVGWFVITTTVLATTLDAGRRACWLQAGQVRPGHYSRYVPGYYWLGGSMCQTSPDGTNWTDLPTPKNKRQSKP